MLEDVHRLATRYHWSEEAILRLPLRRRGAYLRLIDRDDTRALVAELGLEG
jgi:hypothetical protein